jgi:hypothetical protein
LRQHEPRRIARQSKAGREIDGDYAFEVFVLPIDERDAVLDSGVVDQDVQAPMDSGNAIDRGA